MASARAQVLVAAAIIALTLSAAAKAQEPADSLTELLAIPPLERLKATVERPLFVPGRRPPAPAPKVVEAPPVEVPSAEAPAELTGIVIGPEGPYALLTKRDSDETELVRKGQTIADWSLEEIGPQYIVLRRGQGRMRLELFDEKKAGSSRRRPDEDDIAPPRRRSNQPRTRPNPSAQAQQRPGRRNPRRDDDD